MKKIPIPNKTTVKCGNTAGLMGLTKRFIISMDVYKKRKKSEQSIYDKEKTKSCPIKSFLLLFYFFLSQTYKTSKKKSILNFKCIRIEQRKCEKFNSKGSFIAF